ncbi:MAG: response regulator transcription factor, partial [Chloroflexota bacterium]|nr:response regulator transcription factor [Chloroflexota bacterium]
YYAIALTARGEEARALAAYQESITLLWKEGDRWGIMYGLTWMLGLALEHAPAERVARLIGAFDALREEIGHPLPPRHVALHERVIATARAALGPLEFDAVQAAGRALTLEDAIAEVQALAITVSSGAGRARRDAAGPISMLTRREVEVLRLIAAGQSNQQVADALFISPRTASTHAANILDKLGLNARAEAIAFAHRHGLT